MTKTVCIVQARLRSTRLPAKVLLPLPTGRTVLQEVLYRCKQIQGVDEVVCAIPDSLDCDILLPQIDVRVVRGPEQDVLKRYVIAASASDADVVMRVTADCPLIDASVCSEMLMFFRRHGTDYLSNSWPSRSFPHGLDCEIFSRQLLLGADAKAGAEEREHVTTWMQANETARGFYKSHVDRSHFRWTLDTIDDYVTIWNLMANEAHPCRRASGPSENSLGLAG